MVHTFNAAYKKQNILTAVTDILKRCWMWLSSHAKFEYSYLVSPFLGAFHFNEAVPNRMRAALSTN